MAVISNRTIAQWRAHAQHLSSPTAQDPAGVVRGLLGTRRAARGAPQSVPEDLESFEHEGQTHFHALGSAPPSSRASAPQVHILHLFDETYRGYQASRHVVEGGGQGARQRESARASCS